MMPGTQNQDTRGTRLQRHSLLVHLEDVSIFDGEINRGPPSKPHQTSVKWEMREEKIDT